MDDLLNIVRESLSVISNPRFYETERGFQGALLTELNLRLPSLSLKGAIIEQEYQKRMPEHGFRIRPDIIIHVPFEEDRHNSRREGNIVAFELKLNANQDDAFKDYENLSKMCEVLGYPLCIFINIASSTTFLNQYQGSHKEKLHAFSVCLDSNQVRVKEEHAT
jgi:hypothetical protein